MPKPSMHEVVTGLWSPNAADTAANIIAGFGTTTNIINGAIECGKGSETAQSVSRTGYYRSLCSRLGAVCFNTPDTCGSMQKFPDGGAARKFLHRPARAAGLALCVSTRQTRARAGLCRNFLMAA